VRGRDGGVRQELAQKLDSHENTSSGKTAPDDAARAHWPVHVACVAVLVLVAVVMAPPGEGQSTGRGSLAISSGDRLKVSTSISATKTAPTATVATAAPPTMRAANMPTMLMGFPDRGWSQVIILSMGL
jgi:hypothetical protein